MPLPTAADLVFSEQANHNFSRTLGELKRHNLSIHNRLRSIEEDAAFAQNVHAAYGRPLIANERCGSWYIHPNQKGGSAYFKSTDGHTGVWNFSSRRLNLHLLEIIGKHDGCIIVDSTRRGKTMPDALSKTVPIWCSVVNRMLFPNIPQFHNLHTPPQVVSDSEHAQISARLPSFQHTLEALDLSSEALRLDISKPLRPIWVTPDSTITATASIFEDFHPIICCTVSRRVAGGVIEGDYVQGAGDDSENWAHGLSPPIFWENYEALLSTSESDLPEFIDLLVGHAEKTRAVGEALRCVEPTSTLFVARIPAMDSEIMRPDDLAIILSPIITAQSTWRTSRTRFDIGLGPHKVGSRNLRLALPHIVGFVKENISQLANPDHRKRLVVCCESGKDLAIGVALTLICLFFDNDGQLLEEMRSAPIDKSFIRTRLGWISTSMPDANPNRATLQSINSFLMERPK
ncbi:Uncharacterized protein BP5553_09473 [Venustampulla echinocandica]|uniref:Initiator tRNA phosphoribosyl transferase n=1 Tax=Venustampulla echinocandica TaxID=2656787 RepID=A0A370TCX0_9HELO|nr:Uncharacterized protein BP5553_09473 [Venustampulla echinocandica]RDL32071.1 Uncharacterized protein BP5553_09473 [Venustampulla echinocandica]